MKSAKEGSGKDCSFILAVAVSYHGIHLDHGLRHISLSFWTTDDSNLGIFEFL